MASNLSEQNKRQLKRLKYKLSVILTPLSEIRLLFATINHLEAFCSSTTPQFSEYLLPILNLGPNETEDAAERWKKAAAELKLLFHSDLEWQWFQNKVLQTTAEPTAVCLIRRLCHAERREALAARRRTRFRTSSSVWVTRREKEGLCNVTAALEGAFSSLKQITEVTPSASPARGLHTVVRATK